MGCVVYYGKDAITGICRGAAPGLSVGAYDRARGPQEGLSAPQPGGAGERAHEALTASEGTQSNEVRRCLEALAMLDQAREQRQGGDETDTRTCFAARAGRPDGRTTLAFT